MKLKIGLVQANTGIDPAANARDLCAAIAALADDGAAVVFTPEMSNVLDRDRERVRPTLRTEADDPVVQAVRGVALAHRVHVALGSCALLPRPDAPLPVNRSLLIGPDGGIAARYDKIHLFDVDLPGQRFRESAGFEAGDRAVTVALPWATLGLSVCYDVRFPALYRALAAAGADLLAVPAAFTVPTGQAHWHVLLRARAIETGCFVVAAAQSGRHADGRETYGHSLVVDPWGQVLLDLGEGERTGIVDIDLAAVAAARSRIPALANARAFDAP